MGLLHRQQMNWFRLPIVGLPGTACVIPVTPDGRATAPVKPHAVIRHLAELPATVRRLG